jgi:hypothetical protein
MQIWSNVGMPLHNQGFIYVCMYVCVIRIYIYIYIYIYRRQSAIPDRLDYEAQHRQADMLDDKEHVYVLLNVSLAVDRVAHGRLYQPARALREGLVPNLRFVSVWGGTGV